MAALVAVSVYYIVPPGEKTHLGLDLQGGLEVVYPAQTTEGKAPRAQMDQTVGILDRRVNGLGVTESADPEAGHRPDLGGAAGRQGCRSRRWRSSARRRSSSSTGRREIAPRRGRSRSKEEALKELKRQGVSQAEIDQLAQRAPSTSYALVGRRPMPRRRAAASSWFVYRRPPAHDRRRHLQSARRASQPGQRRTCSSISPTTAASSSRRSRASCTTPARSRTAADVRHRARQRHGVRPEIDYTKPICATASAAGAEISGGNMTVQESKDLALVLNTGALPVKLEPAYQQQVSATLGKDSLRAGPHRRRSSASALVLIYMLVLLPLPRPRRRPRAHRLRHPALGSVQRHPGHAHAAGHRRHDPHHRRGRRRQRGHLRAHQGRGAPRQDRALRRELRLRARLQDHPRRQHPHDAHGGWCSSYSPPLAQGLRAHAHPRRARQHAHRGPLHARHARRARAASRSSTSRRSWASRPSQIEARADAAQSARGSAPATRASRLRPRPAAPRRRGERTRPLPRSRRAHRRLPGQPTTARAPSSRPATRPRGQAGGRTTDAAQEEEAEIGGGTRSSAASTGSTTWATRGGGSPSRRVIIAVGLISLFVRGGGNPVDGLNYGLEFKEGTRITVAFEQQPSAGADVRTGGGRGGLRRRPDPGDPNIAGTAARATRSRRRR